VLALDAGAVAQEGRQSPPAGLLGGPGFGRVLRPVGGGEQVGQDLRLQPVGADLAPHRPHRDERRVALGKVGRVQRAQP
jgi:hypothetical protein